MARTLAAALALFIAFPAFAQSEWDGVDRIVVIGDLEGDSEKFEAMLRDAGLTDEDGDWIGGDDHLVQLGDIPDRGPNSRAIMDHLMELERQARRAGGMVHALVGNHEAMNVEGDLRYVDPGEYAAFVDRRSERRQEQYYQQTIDYIRANATEEQPAPAFDDAFRADWETQFPLGYVEHRIAWQPGGDYGDWVAEHNSVVRINDTLFLHAGIGPTYVGATRDAMNEAVRAGLRLEPDPAYPDILVNEDGPLWYRGFALNPESTEAAQLDAVLAAQGVSRIVTGHTKLASMVYPRFDGRVIVADIGVPEGFPDPYAYLIIEGDQLTAVHRGHRVPIGERCGYVQTIQALDPAGAPGLIPEEACGPPTGPQPLPQ